VRDQLGRQRENWANQIRASPSPMPGLVFAEAFAGDVAPEEHRSRTARRGQW
jgi:hypothetical protein